jgi:hydroxymethylbilane synthase
MRPDLRIEPLRGNLDTRLRKLDEGGYDAIVLAAAGLKRLGLGARIRALFEVDVMIPCAGQGALGIEVRSDADVLRAQLATLRHQPTWLATQSERAVSRALGGSCSVPLAAHAVWSGDTLSLNASLGHPEQTHKPLLKAFASAAIDDDQGARALGERVARQLRDAGADDYLSAA